MKERSILFSSPMVRAILAGAKTQTRRLNRLPQDADSIEPLEGYPGEWAVWKGGERHTSIECPYGQPGDRLWIRETWQYTDWTEDGYPFVGYRADGAHRLIDRGIDEKWSDRLTDIWAARWRPAISMPRWASRITLELTDVRVERLQDISDEDARAEGIDATPWWGFPPIEAYKYTWTWWYALDAEYARWGSNPWVFVLCFRRLRR